MMHLKAYAKINLGLRILRKREDRNHNIETIFHRINLFDEITLNPSPTISMECDTPELPADEENLCVAAARALQTHCNITAGVKIFLQKRIPIGAGLGGGSSDAAATLLGLNAMWNLRLGTEELLPIASRLGADVPYFLREGTAYATGRGEILEYLPLNLPYWIVVVYPGIKVSTAWAYEQLKVKNSKSKIRLSKALVQGLSKGAKLDDVLSNDFEPVVFRAHPELADMKRLFYETGSVFAQMSGSGSSVYGLFEKEETARKAMQAFHQHSRIFLTQPHFGS